MNIFATGMNPVDANSLKRAPRVPIFQAFGEAMRFLESRGERLTWQRSRVGDPLPPGTDAVIVSSMLPRSLNCPYAFGVIWTISEALRLDVPLVIYLTDWAFFRAHHEFRSIAKAGPEYFDKKIGGKLQYNESPEAMRTHGEALLEVCAAYGDPHSKLWRNAQVLVPKYAHWGDVKIIQRFLPGAHDVFSMDPSPLFQDYLNRRMPPEDPRPMDRRAKNWILPSLLVDDTWLDEQGLEWTIDRFGPKGYAVLEDECEVQRAYRRRVGALCPPYPTAGSGWWRSRWIHSARANSVLLCDRKDGSCLGPAYGFVGTQVEAMTIEELKLTAEYQKDTLNLYLQLETDWLANELYAPFRVAGALG